MPFFAAFGAAGRTCGVYRRSVSASPRDGRAAARVLALAVAPTIAERLRGHILSGFPWNSDGYARPAWPVLAQTASIIGLWGPTPVAVAIFAALATLADEQADTPPRCPRAPTAAKLLPAAAAKRVAFSMRTSILVFVLRNVRLRIAQPNCSMPFKWPTQRDRRSCVAYLAEINGPCGIPVLRDNASDLAGIRFSILLTREGDAGGSPSLCRKAQC